MVSPNKYGLDSLRIGMIFLQAFLFIFLFPKTLSATTTFVTKGLTLIKSPNENTKGFTILKINPKYFRLKILSASHLNLKDNLSAKDWVKKHQLVAAINGGMYQKDYRTSVGLLIMPGHINNPRIHKHNAILAFDPTQKNLPSVQIIDQTCQSFETLKPQYRSLLQSIRMVSCHQKNTWQEGGNKWPIAALGMDKKGNLLMIFSTKALTPHVFTDLVLSLSISLFNLMYLEGGPPAQFYLKHGNHEIDLSGSYANPVTQDSLPIRTPIPNVIGIILKN